MGRFCLLGAHNGRTAPIALGWPCAVAAALSIGYASPAHAVEFEVSSDVAAQGYEVVSPWGDVVLGRRRLMATVGLAAYDLKGDSEPMGPSYSVLMRMRVDADFGAEDREYRYSGPGDTRFVPGYEQRQLDLMYGYVEGRRLFKGWLDFRLGRQYTSDVLGWWSFDGGQVSITTPYFVQLHLFGGLEQRGGFPLSTDRFTAGGVWRGSESQVGGPGTATGAAYPSYQGRGHAPAFGAALETNGPNWIHGKLVYRRVYNTGSAWTGPFLAPGSRELETIDETRISQDRLGYAVTAFLSDFGGLRGGFAYDLYSEEVTRAFGNLDFYLSKNTTVSIDGETYKPSFDADSIWNWFTHHRITTAQARAHVRPHRRVDLTGSAGVRLWMSDGDPAQYAVAQCTAMNPGAVTQCLQYGLDPSFAGSDGYSRDEANRETTIAPDVLANLGGRYRWHRGRVALRGSLQTGVGDESVNRGRRAGGTLSARQSFAREVVWLGGRVSVYNWDNPLRPHRNATSFGYVVAPEYRPFKDTTLRLEWEHNMNRLVGQRFRLLGLVSFRVNK